MTQPDTSIVRDKVFILCPADTTSGGPEALHQFAGALRRFGVDAAMVYYGARANDGATAPTVPPPYRRYGVAVSRGIADSEGAVIVVPEVATSMVWRFTAALKAVWWLSVDNFFKWQHLNPGPSVLETPRPDIVHLCQSAYALDFLTRCRVAPCFMLSDYLSDDFLVPGSAVGRPLVVAFNPKKGRNTLARLIARDAGATAWFALENLDKPAMAQALRQARVYVDFGEHPGRDRIPREAALSGAVVITGRRGAAAFAGDLPIPDRFRLDEAAPDFERHALTLIGILLTDDAAFAAASAAQEPYRAWIRGNRAAFLAEADALVTALCLTRHANTVVSWPRDVLAPAAV